MSERQRDGCLFCSIARIILFVISTIVGWAWLKRRLEEDDQIRELEREIRDLPLDSRKRLLARFPDHMQENYAPGAPPATGGYTGDPQCRQAGPPGVLREARRGL